MLVPNQEGIDVGPRGADEDDFHIIKRRTAHVDKEEKNIEREQKQSAIKTGVLTGTVVHNGAKNGTVNRRVVFF